MYLVTSVPIAPPPWQKKISPWSLNFCTDFCSLCFLWFLESFSFLPVLAFPVLLNTCFWAWALWTLVLPGIRFTIKLCPSRKQFPKESFVYCLWCSVEDIATFSSWWFCLVIPRFSNRHMKDLMAYRGAILWNPVSFINWKQTNIYNWL